MHAVFVDLRSPKEFNEDHLPNAVNIPLLNDEERHLVGTVYKKDGSTVAKEIGLELVAPKLPLIVKKIKQLDNQNPVVIYCWRGGLRSRSLTQVLNLMGVSTYRLTGGYKAFRKHVYDFFQKKLPYKLVVLHGLTGTGKTDIILELQKLGKPAIDLEGLANNRGSVFGSVGLGPQYSQKKFETRLFQVCKSIQKGSFVVVEGESKRLGRNFIPDSFFEAMNNGINVLVHDNLERRITRIVDEYKEDSQENTDAILHSISCLKKRLGKKVISNLSEMLLAGNVHSVVEYLLINYYDPLYNYPKQFEDECSISLSGTDPQASARTLVKYLNR